jgi:hypothetical protein
MAETKTITLTEPDALGAVRWEFTYVDDEGNIVDEQFAVAYIGEGYNAVGQRVAGVHGVPDK